MWKENDDTTGAGKNRRVNEIKMEAGGFLCIFCVLVTLVSFYFFLRQGLGRAWYEGGRVFFLLPCVIVIILLTACKKWGIFVWNFGSIFLGIFLELCIGYGNELSQLFQMLVAPSYIAIVFAELLFTIYVNYLRSKRNVMV